MGKHCFLHKNGAKIAIIFNHKEIMQRQSQVHLGFIYKASRYLTSQSTNQIAPI